jgi:large subunit ribosomal protein L22
MGKEKSPPRFGENQAGATAKYVRVPPRKARLVVDAIRGKHVADALAILKFVPNFAARAIEKVIESAVANAENSRPISEATGRPLPPMVRENLKVVRVFVDEGPRIKRIQPRAQGRAFRILKRMCHITVILEEAAPRPRPVRRRPTSRRPPPSPAARPAVVAPAAEAPAPSAEPGETTTAVEETAAAEAVTTEEAASAAVEETTPPAADAETEKKSEE